MARPTLTCGDEIWLQKKQFEQGLITFKNKLSRKICELVFDTERNQWRVKYYREIREETDGTPFKPFFF